MSDINKLGAQDPSNDPSSFSNAGLVAKMIKELDQMLLDIKAGKDVSQDLALVMFQMQQFGGNVVGQDSEAQTAMTGYLAGVANIQNLTNSKPHYNPKTHLLIPPTKEQEPYDVNKWTGKSTGIKVTPEVALADQMKYLLNNPKQPYKLDANGSPVIVNGKKVANPSYAFFKKHPALYNSMKVNLASVINAFTSKDGKTSGKVTGDGPNANVSIPPGAIERMWDSAHPQPPAPGGKAITPDPTILNQVTSAEGSVNQSYTSGSSAMQAVSKTNIQSYNAEQGNLNKYLQAMTTLMKAMVQGQRSQ